jgi:hypothetical protein
MADPLQIDKLSTQSLKLRCRQESELFFRRQENDPRFCFELFRRAILKRDEISWECIYSQYLPLVTNWLTRHPLFSSMEEEMQYFVNRVFEKMWASLTPEKFPNFPDLKSILRYMQMCSHSVLIDSARRLQNTLSMDETEANLKPQEAPASLEQQVDARLNAGELWRIIEKNLKNETERQVLYGAFVLGQKPDELFRTNKNRFESVEAVYRIKERVLSRLRRDRNLKEFFTNV